MTIYPLALKVNQWSVVLAILILGGISVSACQKKNSSSVVSTTVSNPPVGVVNNLAGFYVQAQQNSNYTYYTHKGGESSTTPPTYGNSFTWTQNCVANVGDDIMCYVEGAEFDLWFNGLVLQYNVPSTMCTYLTVSLPWHFQYPAGEGPVSVAFQNVTAGLTTSITDQVNSSQGKAYCPFDYSATPGLPNCCEGSYTEIITSTGGATPSPATSSTNNWGGKVSNCAVGPAVDLMAKTSDGLPTRAIINVGGVGINGIYTIASPHSKNFNSNFYIANYFDIETSKNYNPYDLVLNSGGLQTNDYPPAFFQAANPYLNNLNSISIPNTAISVTYPVGSTLLAYNGDPFFTYTCYDNYKETVARIRVMVRSWDTASQLNTATSYTPNYLQETGVGATTALHDFQIWGDLFFNYTDNSGTTLRTSWANTPGGQVSCTTLSSVSNIYTTSPCRVPAVLLSPSDGFPGSSE